jgi:hypothetical protein
MTDESDGEFDLDIRIDDLGVVGTGPDRIHLAGSVAVSCSFCCPTAFLCSNTEVQCHTADCTAFCAPATGQVCN